MTKPRESDAYCAGYAAAMERVRAALHEGWVRAHPDRPDCVLVPDGTRAERLLCRLYQLSEPGVVSRGSRARATPEARDLRVMRGGKRG